MGQESITYSTFSDELKNRFPEMKKSMEQFFGPYYDLTKESPDAYPLFEDVFYDLFVKQLENTSRNPGLFSRMLTFLEEMANSCDRQVVNLLVIGLLVPLAGDRKRLSLAWKDLGQTTRQTTLRIIRERGWEDHLPADPGTHPNSTDTA